MRRFLTLIGLVALCVCPACSDGRDGGVSRVTDADFPEELAGIQDQMETGFCQSYAVTALLEHLWVRKAKTQVKFSEKFTAKAALESVVRAYWNEHDGKFDDVLYNFHIGNVGMAAVFRGIDASGVVPDTAFPTVDRSGAEPKFNLDMEGYGKLVEQTAAELNAAGVTKDVFMNKVESLFGAPTPFTQGARVFSYETFDYVDRVFHNAGELKGFLEFKFDDYSEVYNTDAFVEGMNMFNPELMRKMIESDQRFAGQPVQSHAAVMIGAIEDLLDEGVPVVFWNKWQKIIDGKVQDTGGHLTILVGYEKLADGTTWYRIKNSTGVNDEPRTREFPGTPHPIKTVKGYTYFEKETLAKAMLGIFVPSFVRL